MFSKNLLGRKGLQWTDKLIYNLGCIGENVICVIEINISKKYKLNPFRGGADIGDSDADLFFLEVEIRFK